MNILEKKMALIDFVFPKLRTPKTCLHKCRKSPVPEDPLRSKMVDVHKRYCILIRSTFLIFIDHFQVNLVRKSPPYLDEKPSDCFLTHWRPMESILFLVETYERYQFRCNYLTNKNIF